MWVVRRPSASRMLTTPAPATWPAKTTTPAVTVVTGSPTEAANSTPLLPGSHFSAGGANPLMTGPSTGGVGRFATLRAGTAATLWLGAGKASKQIPTVMISRLMQTDLLMSSVIVTDRDLRQLIFQLWITRQHRTSPPVDNRLTFFSLVSPRSRVGSHPWLSPQFLPVTALAMPQSEA